MRDAEATARTLGSELADGREAEVVAESEGTGARSVEAVALLEPRAPGAPEGSRRCRILLVRARTDPDHWTPEESSAPDLLSCANRAVSLTTPAVVGDHAAAVDATPAGTAADRAADATATSAAPPSTDPVPTTGRTSDG